MERTDRAGLDRAGLDRMKLDAEVWTKCTVNWTLLNRIGLDCTGLNWARRDRNGLTCVWTRVCRIRLSDKEIISV